MKFPHRPRDSNTWEQGLDEEYLSHLHSSCFQALWRIHHQETLPPQYWVIKPNTCTKLSMPFYHIALTSLPKMSLRSWMRIQPNLQPGTSQRLASPPQDRMGTLVLRVAIGSYLWSENTWGKAGFLNALDPVPPIPFLRHWGTEQWIGRPLPTLRYDWIPRGSGKLIQRHLIWCMVWIKRNQKQGQWC